MAQKIYLSYFDCKNIAINHLKNQKNLYSYLMDNNFSKSEYDICIQIKNNKDKKNYPDLIIKIINLIYPAFIIKKSIFYELTIKSQTSYGNQGSNSKNKK